MGKHVVFRPLPLMLLWVLAWAVGRMMLPELTGNHIVGLVLAGIGFVSLLVEYSRSVDLNMTRFVRDLVASQITLVLATLVLTKCEGWQLLDVFVALAVVADAVLSTYVSYGTALRNWAGNTQVSVGETDQGES